MTMDWRKLLNNTRFSTKFAKAPPPQVPNGGTYKVTDFQDDFGRIVHSSAFRRLKNKTQVHTMPGNDYVRDGITHSYEVAHIGRNLGNIIGSLVVDREALQDEFSARDFGEIVGAACLAHDLGNPPFGHIGEQAIKSWCKANVT